MNFSLTTYNVLHDELADPALYPHVKKEILAWKCQFPRICKKLEEKNSDIICLQELTLDSFAEFEKALKNYEGAFAQKGNGTEHGLGTFVRKALFPSITHTTPYLCKGTCNDGIKALQP